MKVHLTFDVEIWCNSWSELDARFPAAFERYVYGRSTQGDFALPKTLEILGRHGLKGIFFVEPLFSARFGSAYLRELVALIDAAGQDIQLHLHPEWTDEIHPRLIANADTKRQHLTAYTFDEQLALIDWGRQALEDVLGRPIGAFRAGSFAANANTFRALSKAGLLIDSSLNDSYAVSGNDVPRPAGHAAAMSVQDVWCYPVSRFTDGLGRARPAQINGCSFEEIRDALDAAERSGQSHFVIVSHNFEMLKPGSNEPDRVVVHRFERLCAWLAAKPSRFQVGALPPRPLGLQGGMHRVGRLSTARRLAEQALRRLG